MKFSKATVITGFIGTLYATEAFAHHAMGGATPASLTEGLLSGFAHPVIGIDHLAFVIAMGLAAGLTSRTGSAPAMFVCATIAGCLLSLAGIGMPGVELAVAASVVLAGAFLASGRTRGGAGLVGAFGLAGIFHGMAYATAIVGAERTPLIAYLAGFACVQLAVALTAGLAARRLAGSADAGRRLHPRLAGAVSLGIGIAILVDNLEGLFAVA